MIPRYKNVIPGHPAIYGLLEEDDLIEPTDEYYNNFTDEWLPVQKEFIGYEYCADESKPVRRKLKGE